MSKPTVFISHSQRDADVAHKVEKALQGVGFDVVNPGSDLPPGEDWRKGVKAAIRRSDAVVMVVATPQNLSSSWMSYEAGVAEALRKQIIVLLSNRYSVTELPADAASADIVDFDPQAPERAAPEIAARLAMV